MFLPYQSAFLFKKFIMKQTINCIIIDDEELAIKVIENHLGHFPNFQIKGRFLNPLDALPVLQIENIDVIFLDINMSIMNGLDFLQNLEHKPLVVITTAYREFAVESFNLNVLDYLVKPISLKRFMNSIERIQNQLQLQRQKQPKDYFFIKVNKKMLKINFDDILYIESLRDYVEIVTSEDTYLVLSSMTAIIEQLPTDIFLRIHRSYSINMQKIRSIDGNLVELPGKKIPIGRNYLNLVKQKLLGN